MTADDTMMSDKNTRYSRPSSQQSDLRIPITSLAVASTFNPSVILISELRSSKISQQLKKTTNVKTTLMITACTVYLPKTQRN
jgi:hypothetical protein